MLASFGGNPGTATGTPTGSSGTAGGAGATGIGLAAGSNANVGNPVQLSSGYETGNATSGASSNWQQTQYYR